MFYSMGEFPSTPTVTSNFITVRAPIIHRLFYIIILNQSSFFSHIHCWTLLLNIFVLPSICLLDRVLHNNCTIFLIITIIFRFNCEVPFADAMHFLLMSPHTSLFYNNCNLPEVVIWLLPSDREKLDECSTQKIDFGTTSRLEGRL